MCFICYFVIMRSDCGNEINFMGVCIMVIITVNATCHTDLW